MQLVGDVAPLLFLHRDELPVEAAILLACEYPALGERVEAVGDDGEFLHLWRGQARRVVPVPEPCHAAGQVLQRVQHPAEHDIKKKIRMSASSASRTMASE